MSIQLTTAQEQVIHNKLQTGHYSSAEEVLEIALQLLDQYESGEADWLENVRDKVDAAYETIEPPIDGSTFVNQLRQRFQPT
jgi:antitoxin ParD1/3/4